MTESRTELKEIKPDYGNSELEQPKFGSEVFGKFRTVKQAPTLPPKNYLDQIVIMVDGLGTNLLYIYDYKNNVWFWVALN